VRADRRVRTDDQRPIAPARLPDDTVVADLVPSSMTTLGPTTLKRPISTLAAIRAAGSMYDSPGGISPMWSAFGQAT